MYRLLSERLKLAFQANLYVHLFSPQNLMPPQNLEIRFYLLGAEFKWLVSCSSWEKVHPDLYISFCHHQTNCHWQLFPSLRMDMEFPSKLEEDCEEFTYCTKECVSPYGANSINQICTLAVVISVHPFLGGNL